MNSGTTDSIELDGTKYCFIELIESLDGSGYFVLCASNSGQKKCIERSKWESLLIEQRNNAPSDFANSAGSAGCNFAPQVTTSSSKEEKLGLFKSLFRGREDAYAESYFSKKRGKLEYAPACALKWKKPVCKKPNIKCSACKHRLLSPLTDELLVAHMIGRKEDGSNTIGIYPLVNDNLTYFLAADFDGEGWQDAAHAYKRALLEKGVCGYTERSRSGNGAHVWVFFECAVSARKARLLGTAALTRAMEECIDIPFDSYDRFFPNQDVAPDGGFGNLIALPLQGRALKNGNSVFVDDNMKPFEDQWIALSNFVKVSKEQLDNIIPDKSDEALGLFVGAKGESEPWEKRNTNKASIKERELHFVRSNMLFIEKEGLSPQIIYTLRRLAAFVNPDYQRAAAMRQSLRSVPRIIYAGKESSRYLGLPRGCEDAIRRLTDANSVELTFDDKREVGRALDISFTGELKPEQQRGKDALLEHDIGVLSAATGFGKTILGASLIAELAVPALVLVPSTALLQQWREQLLKFLEIREDLPELLTKTGRKSRKKRSVVGQIGAGKNLPSGIVDVAIPASLFEDGEILGERKVKDFVKNYGLVICDECHHVPSARYEEVVNFANAKRVYGLSATPMRKDRLDPIIFMQCGPIRFEFGSKDQSAKQSFKRVLVPRFTRFRLGEEDRGKSFTALLDLLCEDPERNALIVGDIENLAQGGRNVLVLTRRVKHAKRIAKELETAQIDCLLLIGSDDKKTRESKLDLLKGDMRESPKVIVATGNYVGEGFDCSKLDALVLAAPISWKGLLAQYAGRLHRDYDGKRDVVIYDYADACASVFDNMYRKRLRQYAELGYEVMSVDTEAKVSSMLNGEAHVKDFIEDINAASRSIFISSPRINYKKVLMLIPPFREAVERGLNVCLAIDMGQSGAEDAGLATACENLKACGVNIREEQQPPCLSLIDGKVVWYGGISLLAFNKKDSQVLRFESRVIADELSVCRK